MQFDIISMLFIIPAMLLSSAVHEFAHAYTAYRLGDDTARAEGRMTLNPLAHIDLIGLFMMVFGRIGWSKPVPVNSYNFENPVVGNALVSAAGPASNFGLVIVSAILLRILIMIPLPALVLQLFATFFTVMLFINCSLMLFNLLPIPPLDGSNIVEMFLPKAWRAGWSGLAQYAPIILLLLILPFSPLFAIFSSFWYNLLTTVVKVVLTVFGLPGIL
ncbi:site-2 protease family protein [Candidatus Dojkabacteria bacterium CG_4_10_14_3_um_filter_Dojkabacteria_WS6_41_9]|nr:MAG: site-2 protease family protein [Candidatus Dojkabacteria bacterium CG_4_10_14_3_um_filter_Dojkabacteria_WS6_41_9]